jgi:hypothetical protein
MRETREWIFSLCMLLIPFCFHDGGTVGDLGQLVPKKIGAWRASAEDAVYNRQTLYDYMDGGAEVYLAFDFQRVFARKYAGPGGLELGLDIYDMGSPEEAFGIFSCDRADPAAGIGQESEYGFGLLRFRQGRYFVTITSGSEDEESGKAILEIGRIVATVLGPPGPKPGLLALLPAKDLLPDRTSYFHGNISLNNRYFIASDNILGLDRTTDCAFAEYAPAPGGTGYLLLIRYPDAGRARAAHRSFLSSYLPEAGPDGLGRTENKKWTAASRQDTYLAIVFEAPTPDWAKEIRSSIPFPMK